MKNLSLDIRSARLAKYSCLLFAVLFSKHADANFFADASNNVILKSYFDSKSYDNDVGNVNNWSQAFLYKFSSGYTDTPIQFGFDFSIKYAVATKDNENRNFIQTYKSWPDKDEDLLKVGYMFKAKYKNTELRAGEFYGNQNMAEIGGDPLLPGTFWGVKINHKINANLSFNIGRLWDGTRPYEDKIAPLAPSLIPHTGNYYEPDYLDTLTINYKQNDKSIGYELWYLKDIFSHHWLNYTQKFPHDYALEAKFLKTDKIGDAMYGDIDAGLAAIKLTKQFDHQALSIAYQNVFGNYSYHDYGGLLSNYLFINYSVANVGRAEDEKTYHLIYEYDFGKHNLAGLKTQLFYSYGHHISYSDQKDLTESEYGLNLNYRIPEGKYKGLGFKTVLTKHRNGWSKRGFEDGRFWVYYQKSY